MRKEKWDGYEGPIVDKLTDDDLQQQDFVDNKIQELICELAGQEIEWNIDIIHSVLDTIREKLWEYYKIKIPYASIEVQECLWWYDKECGECKGTEEDFINNCKKNEMFIEMAYQCPKCKRGIINPTYRKTMACDKCDYDRPIQEVAQIYKDLQNYL